MRANEPWDEWIMRRSRQGSPYTPYPSSPTNISDTLRDAFHQGGSSLSLEIFVHGIRMIIACVRADTVIGTQLSVDHGVTAV
jgi:hypothetical protein